MRQPVARATRFMLPAGLGEVSGVAFVRIVGRHGKRIVAALASAAFIVPAIGLAKASRDANSRNDARAPLSLGHFTPAAADPKLAALLARNGLDGGDFRFTPAESRQSGSRSVTVAVRARSNAVREAQPADVVAVADTGSIGIRPIAYDLGVAVGWKRFAVSGDVSRIDLGGLPGSRESADVGVTYSGRRFTGRVVATAERPLADQPKIAGSEGPSYSLDVGGSYSLSRRIDVTAGVRYKTQNFRLDRVAEDRHDSQAVYIGTALRF